MKRLNQFAKGANTALMILVAFVAAVMLVSGLYILNDVFYTNRSEFVSYDLLQYRPKVQKEDKSDNNGFEDLQKINPDTVGWIEIFGTNINYPVVQGDNNLEYLNKDIYGYSTASGSIYLAAENNSNFSDWYNLIYGHHMDSGAMFGDIGKYLDPEYFKSHSDGIIQTPDGNYSIHVFACVQTNAYEEMKYVSHSAQQSAPERSQTPNQSVTVSTTGTVHEDPVHNSEVTGIPEETENDHTEESEYDASVPFITEQKIIEITNKMQEVSLYSSDLIGWIYIADSDIDYPVVKSRDNQYYLYHSPDGRENRAGSIFLSYHCSPDLSDALNIVYGHDMQYGMFGDIREFRQREQFDKHRYGWLFTKEDLYLIDFFALSIVSAYDEIYDIPSDRSKWQECLKANSVNYIEPELNDDDSVVVLSTCAYDFENARALFAGKLIRKQKINTVTTERSS